MTSGPETGVQPTVETPLWHTLPFDEVLETLDSDPDDGITEAEASDRLERHGPNEMLRIDRPSSLAILIRQFTSVMVGLLLAAALLSGVVLGEWIDAAAIGAIVILNAAIGFFQESRAAAALAALQSLAVPVAHVVRGGEETEITSVDLVPGDLIVLAPGDRVPADGRIVWIRDLEVDESTLTGESLPVSKSTEPASELASLGDRLGMVHAGTTIARGKARAVIVATGSDTAVGMVAGLTAEKEPQTPLQKELDIVGRRLAVVALAAAALIVAMGLVRGVRFETIVLTGVALAVAVIPEGLPTVVAVTLARGMERMARWKALVRRLAAVEALGAAAVICSDKTGTLTQNRLAVREIAVPGRTLELEEAAELTSQVSHDAAFDRLIEVMVGCNDAFAADGELRGDALDVALLRSALDLGADASGWQRDHARLREIPFESGRKRMDVLVDSDGGVAHLVKGAPEVIVAASDSVVVGDDVVPLDASQVEDITDRAEHMAADGLRTLALAYAHFPSLPTDEQLATNALTLVGVIGLADPPRPDVEDSVAEARRAGIDVVMVTGDHAVTARTIGERVGILDGDTEVMPGERLRSIPQEDLDQEIERYRAFSRVDPADKVKIVTAWQHRGRVVAMTGDGVNDGPALRAADIGVAMGSGTDVAKDASGVVLEDDDFSTIVDAVREGRKIFSNLRNVVHYLLSANLSEIFTMVAGFGLFGALGEPLKAAQLLWINLVSDGLPALALGLDDPKDDVMAKRPGSGRDVLSTRNVLLLLVQGTVLGTAAISMIVVGHYWLELEWTVVQTMLFTTLVVVQLLHAFNVRSSLQGIGGRVGLAALGSFIAHIVVVYAPFTQAAFDIEPLTLSQWAWALGAAVIGFLGARVVSHVFRRRFGEA